MPRLIRGVGKETADAWVEELAAALGSREPRFVQERLLEPGTICWMRSELPHVFVPPDIYTELQVRGLVPCPA